MAMASFSTYNRAGKCGGMVTKDVMYLCSVVCYMIVQEIIITKTDYDGDEGVC